MPVLDLDIETGAELIQEAYKKQLDKKLWDMWLTKYPWMDEENYMSFEDFKDEMMDQENQPQKLSRNEIIEQSERIIALWKNSKL